MQQHLVNEPWHTMGIDIMGPFPATPSQKRFLLVVVDYFTRWVELFPLRPTTSSDVVNVLTKEIFSRYGLPKYIVSDNGPQFVSNLSKCFCESFGLKQNFITNYYPQSNMTERANRTLKPLIAIYAEQQPHSWDSEIHNIAFAIRTAVNETTGDTPAFMMFGRDLRSPIDTITGEAVTGPPSSADEQEQIQEYKTNLIIYLQGAYNLIKEHSEIQKSKQKTKYDRRTTQRQYSEGDLVWVAIPTGQVGDHSISGKLQPRYQGPCRLIKQLTPSTFNVRRIMDNVNLGATNTDRLKPYFEPNSAGQTTTTTSLYQKTNDQPRSRSPSDVESSTGESNLHDESNDKQSPRVMFAPAQRVSNRHRRAPMRFIEE